MSSLNIRRFPVALHVQLKEYCLQEGLLLRDFVTKVLRKELMLRDSGDKRVTPDRKLKGSGPKLKERS